MDTVPFTMLDVHEFELMFFVFVTGIPSVTAVMPNSAPTMGGSIVTIFGLNLGPVKAISLVRIGETTVQVMIPPIYDAVAIRIPEGVGSDLDVVVMTDGKIAISNKQLKFSYDMPAGQSTWPLHAVANHPTSGSVSLTISGSNFGTQDYSTFRRLGVSSAESVRWASDTVVVTKVSAGSFGTLALEMTVARIRNTRTEFFSYNLETTSSVRVQNSPASGSVCVTILGSGMAIQQYTLQARTGETSQESSQWLSDSAVACKSTASMGQTKRLTSTVGIRTGSTSEFLSHSIPVASISSRQNVAGTGALSVTIFGPNIGHFPFSQNIRLRSSDSERTSWESDSSLRVQSALPCSGSGRAAVSVGQRSGSISSLLSASAAILSVLGRANTLYTGSLSITMFGNSLCRTSHSASVSVGITNAEHSVWLSDSAISCKVGHGIFTSRRLHATLGSLVGSSSTVFSAGVHEVSTLKGNTCSSSSLSMTIYGASMGLESYTISAHGRATKCEITSWDSATSARCKSTQILASTRIVLASIGQKQGCSTEGFSADTSFVSHICPSNQGATGSSSVTLAGMGFGISKHTLSALFGQTSCERSKWFSDTALACYGSSGHGFTRFNILTAGQLAGSTTAILSFSKGSISLGLRVNTAATASASVTIYGLNLGQAAFSLRGGLMITATECSVWSSESSILARISHGVKGSTRFLVSLGASVGTATRGHSFDFCAMSVVQSVNVAGTGTVSVSLLGASMHMGSSSLTVRIQITAGEQTTWKSDSSVLCQISHGVHSSRHASLSVGYYMGSRSLLWSFDSNHASALTRSNRAVTGSSSVSVQGAKFGLSLFSPSFRLHTTASEGTFWESDTSLRCRNPEGAISTRMIILTVGISQYSTTDYFSYDIPSMSIVFPVNNPPEGSVTFTIYGKMFGTVSRSIISRLGGTSCESSFWASDTTTFCKMAAGIRGTRRVSVTSKRKVGTRTEIFSYNAPGLSTAIPYNGATTGMLCFCSAPILLNI
jgi:hypothetical protein